MIARGAVGDGEVAGGPRNAEAIPGPDVEFQDAFERRNRPIMEAGLLIYDRELLTHVSLEGIAEAGLADQRECRLAAVVRVVQHPEFYQAGGPPLQNTELPDAVPPQGIGQLH